MKLLLGFALLLAGLAGCSSDGDKDDAAPSTTTTQATSWECLKAQTTGITQGTPVKQARIALMRAGDNADDPTAAYYGRLLERLSTMDDDEPVGTSLNDVPCDL